MASEIQLDGYIRNLDQRQEQEGQSGSKYVYSFRLEQSSAGSTQYTYTLVFMRGKGFHGTIYENQQCARFWSHD